MTDFLTTELARPSEDPATRADAISYLTRTGNADLMPILGLDIAEGTLTIDGQPCCPACRQPYSGDGRTACRRSTCKLGPSARFTRPVTAADEALAREYADGATIVELARRHGISQDKTRQAILRAGGQMRRAVRRPVPGGAS